MTHGEVESFGVTFESKAVYAKVIVQQYQAVLLSMPSGRLLTSRRSLSFMPMSCGVFMARFGLARKEKCRNDILAVIYFFIGECVSKNHYIHVLCSTASRSNVRSVDR